MHTVMGGADAHASVCGTPIILYLFVLIVAFSREVYRYTCSLISLCIEKLYTKASRLVGPSCPGHSILDQYIEQDVGATGCSFSQHLRGRVRGKCGN